MCCGAAQAMRRAWHTRTIVAEPGVTMKLLRHIVVLAVVAIAGCVAAPLTRVEYNGNPPPPPQPREAPPERFSVEEGRAPEVVALFRESPAPSEVRVEEGTDFTRDRTELARQGYVLVGRSLFETTDPSARSRAAERAVAIGAERAMFYPIDPTAENREQQPGGYDSPQYSLVAYFVKYKLTFGATFRNLSSSEKASLSINGGVSIGSVIARTPASEANLLSGDVVYRVNGDGFNGKTAFQKLLAQYAGNSVSLDIYRGGLEMQRIVRLGVPREK